MISLKGVTKKFVNDTALDCIDLNVPKGSAYGLLGSNGAGKSTILRLLSGIYRPDGGEVMIENENVYDNTGIKERVLFINDETVQFNNFTLCELRDYYKTFYGKFSDEKWESLWKVLQLPKDRKISTFSKGMKRQAVVISAIACQPDYLLIDEAFDGLDPTMRIIVKQMLVDAMIDNQLTVVISSHNLREIEEFCDTVGLLHKGHIVFNRELESVKGNIHKIQTAFDAPAEIEDFPDIDILHFDRKASVVYIIAKGDADDIRAKIEAHNPKICDIIPLSLEEIFIYEMEGQGYDYTGISNE